MRTKIIWGCFAILLFGSCKKTDLNPQEQNLPALIDSVSLVDFPGISCKVKADKVPYQLYNPIKLPYHTPLSKVKLLIHTIHATKLEIGEPGKDSVINCHTFLLNPINNSVTITLNYSKPINIRLFDHDFVSEYVLNINENQLPDPRFNNISLKLNPKNLTPLAGILSVSSSEQVSIGYIVKGQDGEDFIKNTTNYAANNQINLFGLYPNTENHVKVIITNREGSIAYKDILVPTGALPMEFPDSKDITVNKLDTAKVKTKFILYYPYKTIGGMPFNNPGNMASPIVLDNHGKVRWYMTVPFAMDMKPMRNGHFMVYYYNYAFKEIDLFGNIYKEFVAVNGHHDFALLPNGNILYCGLDQSINNTDEDKIYEIDYRTGNVVKMINLFDILDPTRPQQPFIPNVSNDWFHLNSLTYDAIDNSIVITGRHQSAICKIDYTTNQLKWIISDPTYWKTPWSNYLLKPTGTNFEYSWGQHSVVLNLSDHNKLMVFDNGNARSYTNPLSATDSYSRLVEYTIDQKGHSVAQSFDFGKEMGSENYSPALGNVDYVTQNLFVCFPLIVKDVNGNAAQNKGTPSVRFMEVDRNKNVVLDMRVRNNSGNPANGYRSYRAHPFSFGL